MGTTIDTILVVAALAAGVLMILGKGDFLLNDKGAAQRNKIYDMKKVQRGFGVMLIIWGVATAVSMRFSGSLVGAVIYIAVVIISLVAAIVYMKKYCKVDSGVKTPES